jgi:ABC-type Fe3+/spermidine/putrescine transport system ATPase subunit
MNVAQNIGFGLRMRGVDQREMTARVKEMLELVRLSGFETRMAHELSGGQQQRVALARALIIKPLVLLLDEPLANLDANLRLEMRELIRNIQRELGITSIFVTHDQEEAVMLADRVALMFEGVLQQFDTPRAFYDRPLTAAIAQFFRNDNFLEGTKRGAEVETSVGTLRITHREAQPDGPVLLTVRPEDVQLGSTNSNNTIKAQVKTSVYMGTYTQLQLNIADRLWRAQGPADYGAQPGDTISIHLPEQRIWLLPRES